MCILDVRMKVKAARNVLEGTPGDFDNNGNRRFAKKVVICKYWAAGCCRKDYCRFSHGGLPPQNLDCLGVKQHAFSPKKWCRDLKSPQKRIASVTRIVPQKVKATSPLKMKTTHPAKKGITNRLIQEAGLIISQKRNAPAVISNEETISSKSLAEVVQENLDNKKSTPNNHGDNIPNNHGDIIPCKVERVCEQWVLGNCAYSAKCSYLHSWVRGDDFSRMALLEGHEKAISGLTLPSGSDHLYSGSTDGTLRSWNCNTGQCADVTNLEGEMGSLISVGSWLFVGMPNSIIAQNIDTSAKYVLHGIVGQVHSIIVVNDVIFAGAQDGVILAWKASSECNLLQPSATLHDHVKAVVSLSVGGNHLYTGSLDHTIKVWDLETLQCLQTLSGHSEAVTSILCLDQFLISSSLDHTIKVWAVNGEGKFEENYTHKEEHGVLALAGLNDFESKPLLLCACCDSSLRIYELPSFCDRGRLFSRQVVQRIHVGPNGIFFTGDRSGCIAVWRMLGNSS